MLTRFERYRDVLDSLKDEDRLRAIPEQKSGLIDLVSNDYLGLAAREPEFREEFLDRFPDASFTSSASRLLSRNQKYHNLLEAKLSEAYGKSVLLFNSGYHANVGILSALSSPDTLILDDELMHASGIDGLMLGRGLRKGNFMRFPHNDMDALARLVKENSTKYSTIIIVTESIFSMDGDLAPLGELIKIRNSVPNALLYLDEAHAFGVRGQRGLGLAEEFGAVSEIDIIVGTFGKAAASSGAFVATSTVMRDYLLNTTRSFIFSTALPPVNMVWTLLMIEKIEEMTAERDHLQTLGREFAALLSSKFNIPVSGSSQIVPFICGSAEKAIASATLLRSHGYDVLPIRRPTVAAGTERLRFSLNSSLTLAQLTPIPDLLTL